ncbi:competence protein ComGC [Bacillus pakistanensis]|uniref:ComG operon protein 3 n=1 Tax=Rossellomorea pakistanensis TaxID=992288 RepID=A0ABS2N9T6_9BACI|nr:competence type IV pilus major pilin ComGC [Bacillus pakistanensis]MBM7584608.1 competence protein ComGC [Bacillus pakistanensis]
MITNQKGFTLIEMMIVLLVISVLLFITIPNVTKQSSSINDKGCTAFRKMVEGQVQAFKVDKSRYPTDIDELVTEKYLKDEFKTCPNGTEIKIGTDGSVS